MVKINYVSPRGVKGTRTGTKAFIDKWLPQMIGINTIHKYKIDGGSWQTVRSMGEISEYAAQEYKPSKSILEDLPNSAIIVGGLLTGFIVMKALKK